MKATILFSIALIVAQTASADTTIDPAEKHAFGANVGWLNAVADSTNGAVIGQAFCSGYMYGANVGWIHLGNGAPINGMAYSNSSNTDYGINHDGVGNLTGYAYAANIGWINFEQTQGQPKVNLLTGTLSGYAWGANIGWISLDGLKTLTLAAPDSDSDGIADAWEFSYTNTLTVLNGGDADDDGMSDGDEYLADTDPLDPNDYFVIVGFDVKGATNDVTWPAKPSRLYTLQHTSTLSNGTAWTDGMPVVPAVGMDLTETVTGVVDSNRFYRVLVGPPLSQ